MVESPLSQADTARYISLAQERIFCCSQAVPVQLITDQPNPRVPSQNLFRTYKFYHAVSHDERRAGSREDIAAAIASSPYFFSVNSVPATTEADDSAADVYNRYFVPSRERDNIYVEVHVANVANISVEDPDDSGLICAMEFSCKAHGSGKQGPYSKRRVILWKNFSFGKPRGYARNIRVEMPMRMWETIDGRIG